MSKKILWFVSLYFIILLIFTGCTKKPKSVDVQNQAPETYIVNVPPDSSYIYHARIIYWYGTDADGIVTRYDWAIDDTTYDENIAGSGWHSLYMDSTLATQDTIAFEAPIPDTEFTHIFYVRAVDNKDKPDPSPATRVFRTSNIPPNTRFISTPKDSLQRFILIDSTDIWKGINFEWTAIDSDQVFPCRFQYCWDDTTINFDPVTHKGWSDPVSKESFYFTGDNSPFEEGYHTIYLRAMDDAGAVDRSLSDTTIWISEIDSSVTPWDTIMDTTIYNQWRTLYFVIPEIGENPDYRNILWVNFTTNSLANSKVEKPFYHSVLDDSLSLSLDSLDYTTGSCDQQLFSNYSTIIWTKGDNSVLEKSFADNEKLIGDFFNVGGRIIFSGSSILLTGKYEPNQTFGLQKPFIFTELHIKEYLSLSAGTSDDTCIVPLETDTAFYNQEGSLPHLSLILPEIIPGNDIVNWIFLRNNFVVEVMDLDIWGEYTGQLDIIYTLNHYRDHADFERKPCATRFTHADKTMPSFFYFGFPISYLEKGRATQLMRTILQELDEIP